MKEKDYSLTGNEEMDEVKNGKPLEGRIVERKEESSEQNVGGALEESASKMNKDSCGVMSNETLIKVKQCYRELDKDDDADDDDEDDDDDHEEDNDDFIKFMWWRKCVALYAPCTTILSPSTSALLDTSGPLNCPNGLCVYYFTDTPTSGSLSVEVMDVTDAIISSSHTMPTPVQEWGTGLTINTVVVSNEGEEAMPRHKTMIIKLSDISKGNEEDIMETGKVKDEGEAAVEAESAEGGYQAVIINAHNHSEALKKLPAECDPLEGVCLVSDLQTLVDPEEQGPVSNIFLLLSNHHARTSSLVSLTDVHARVYKVAPDTALVLWDREPSVQEFTVRLVRDNGESSDTITVACSKRGTDCLATFSSLASGYYRAEVSYMRKAEVVSSFQFFMEGDIVSV